MRIAREGIYGLSQFLKDVLDPVLKLWDVDHLAGLTPEAELARGHVDEDLVTLCGGADQCRVGDRGMGTVAQRHGELLLGSGGIAGADDGPTSQPQHRCPYAARSTSASATSSIPSSASELTLSVGSCGCSVPLPRFRTAQPFVRSAFTSLPPPVVVSIGV